MVRLTRACAVLSKQMNKKVRAVNMAARDNALANGTEDRKDQEFIDDVVMLRHWSSTGRNTGELRKNA